MTDDPPTPCARPPASFGPRFARLLALWLMAAAVPLCAGAEPLRLAVSPTALALPLYVAQQKGFFAAEGLDVQIGDCLERYRCLTSLFDGRADVATATEMPVVFYGFERRDLAVVGTITSATRDLKLVVREGLGVTEAAQLTGKRIGIVARSPSQYFLELSLFSAGVDPRTLAIVPLRPEAMVEALKTAQVDAIAIWEPYAWRASQAPGARGRVLPGDAGYIETFNLVASRRLIPARNADLARLLGAVELAEQFIQQHPDESKAILQTRLQLDRAFVDWVWPRLGFRLALDQSLVSTMQSEARWARREGHVAPGAVNNVLTLIHADPLRRVKPTAVGLVP